MRVLNKEIPNQLVGNIGLFYICYELSKRYWNCLPTTRNARGVDLVIYDQDAKNHFTIQIKALRKRNPVPFGNKRPQLIADFVIIVRNVFDKPEVFIMKSEEVNKRIAEKEMQGKYSYWLQYKDYEGYKERWDIIEESKRGFKR
ncbi:MAG: hypothetical protein QW181_04490 [Candidatus Nitrosocaldus sp.]